MGIVGIGCPSCTNRYRRNNRRPLTRVPILPTSQDNKIIDLLAEDLVGVLPVAHETGIQVASRETQSREFLATPMADFTRRDCLVSQR